MAGALQLAISNVLTSKGPRAFDATQSAAAYHEAGHAVLYALAGIPVQQVWIKEIKREGVLTWIGECQADVTWQISAETPPSRDLLFAKITMAGWCAESVFVPGDKRAGSSLDEGVLAGAVCASVAAKTGRAQAHVLSEAIESVMMTLDVHRNPVQSIAMALIRCRKLHGPQLTRRLPTAELCHAV
jgi:hypothetical protein